MQLLGVTASHGAGARSGGDFDLIATTILTGSATDITFSSVDTYSSTYKHLQLRITARSDRATYSQDSLEMYLNSNTSTSSYTGHVLIGDASSVQSGADVNGGGSFSVVRLVGSGGETGVFSGAIIDILDAYSTSKYKTVKAISGQNAQDAGGFGGKFIALWSQLFLSTSEINTIKLKSRLGTNLVTGTRVSLYGIKG